MVVSETIEPGTIAADPTAMAPTRAHATLPHVGEGGPGPFAATEQGWARARARAPGASATG